MSLTSTELVTTMANQHKVSPKVLLGEVITWAFRGQTIPFQNIIAALTNAQLDPKAARILAARTAFTRSRKVLAEQRIIRKIPGTETSTHITYQFTKEIDVGGALDYAKETDIVLEKDTGYVTCPDP